MIKKTELNMKDLLKMISLIDLEKLFLMMEILQKQYFNLENAQNFNADMEME